MVAMSVVLWDEDQQRARLLPDPLSGLPAVFDYELAFGLAGYLLRHGSFAVGLVPPPSGPVKAVVSALDGVAMADAALHVRLANVTCSERTFVSRASMHAHA